MAKGTAGNPIVPDPVPRRRLGRHPVEVSILGLGGSHLAEAESLATAERIVAQAIDAGIDFFDNAWEYKAGRAEEWMGRTLRGRRDQVFLMTKVCTHGRPAEVAMEQLEQSLRRLGTDHLDLWQVHEVIDEKDPQRHHAPGGVIEALERAREQGKTRFVGFTGHKDPAIHLEMLDRGFAWDACQLPLNCFDWHFRSFERRVLPELVKRGIAPLGMKSMGGHGELLRPGAVEPGEALAYALSLQVATVVSGIDSLAVLEQNLRVARGFTPLSPAEMDAIRQRTRGVAHDGAHERFKTSAHYDGDLGVAQRRAS